MPVSCESTVSKSPSCVTRSTGRLLTFLPTTTNSAVAPSLPRLASLTVTFLGYPKSSYSPFHSPSSSLTTAVLCCGNSTCGGPVFFKLNGARLPACAKSPTKLPSALKCALKVACKPIGELLLTAKEISEPFTAMSASAVPLISSRGIMIDPAQAPSFCCARSTIIFNSLSGICTDPSHRPAGVSERQITADARRSTKASRIRAEPMQTLCPDRSKALNTQTSKCWARPILRDRATAFPPLGLLHAASGKKYAISAQPTGGAQK